MGNKMCMSITKRKKTIKDNQRQTKHSLPSSSASYKINEDAAAQTSKSRISKKPTFVCDLCVEQKPLNESFNLKGCSHFYCNDCITKYVVSKLENNVTSIKCPEIKCQGILECEDCRTIIPRAVFDRWGTALCESVISESEKFYCPYNDCSALLIYDGAGDTFAICPNCSRDICVKCVVPFHSEFSCEEFQKLNKKGSEAMLSKVARKNKWKRCPVCKMYVEKKNGCQFILCRCGHEFCYECGRRSSKIHVCNMCILRREDYAEPLN